jgi:RNA polymerase sigma-70 factor (family 1)
VEESTPGGVCEESVFDQTFLRVAPLLRNFFLYRTGDAERAADLVQDAFLKLYENCSKVLPEAAKAWLFRVAENIFLKQIRREAVEEKYTDWASNQSQDAPSPEEVLEEKEFHQQLLEVIAELPEGAREVFMLNRMDGLKYREIAEMLGISQKAVEKRMHRALTTLRELHPSI